MLRKHSSLSRNIVFFRVTQEASEGGSVGRATEGPESVPCSVARMLGTEALDGSRTALSFLRAQQSC